MAGKRGQTKEAEDRPHICVRDGGYNAMRRKRFLIFLGDGTRFQRHVLNLLLHPDHPIFSVFWKQGFRPIFSVAPPAPFEVELTIPSSDCLPRG